MTRSFRNPFLYFSVALGLLVTCGTALYIYGSQTTFPANVTIAGWRVGGMSYASFQSESELLSLLFRKAPVERQAGLLVGEGEAQVDAAPATLAVFRAERNVERRIAAGTRQQLARILDGFIFQLSTADRAMDLRWRDQHEGAFIARCRAFGGGDIDDDDAVFAGEKARQTVLQKVHFVLLRARSRLGLGDAAGNPPRPRASLLGGPAAIDGDMGAVDRFCRIGGEEKRDGCHLVGADEFLGRLEFQHDIGFHLRFADAAGLGCVGDLLFDQRRQHIAGADRVGGDAVFGDLKRDGLRQAHDAVFCRHIGRLEGRGDEAVRGGDIDDAAPALALHMRNGVADGVERAGKVDRDDLVPLFRRKILDLLD